LDIDFHPPRQARSTPQRRRPSLLLLLLPVVVVVVLALLFSRQTPNSEARSAPLELKAPPQPMVQREVIERSVASGDTITSLLGDFFTPQQILQLSQQSKPVFPLTRICAGQPYKLCTIDGRFERFEYDIDREEQLIIEPSAEDGFAVSKVPIDYTVRVEHLGGTITSSLFEAVAEIGEAPELALSLADIFAWDIDFILDIREGDAFQVLVEKRFRDGQPAGYGEILAAEFTNQGETYRAFRYQDGDKPASFYDAEGNSLRKAFLKAPLAFSRISSGFTMRRFHPITQTWKAHPAIDYAAPTGTPIKAVGDGTISRIGRTSGNGNFIEIRHNSTYKTIYLHMNGFARGMKKGKRVGQGQTIGYVGSTGLATGPHLCFRMYRNDSPVNPTRIKSPAAAPVSEQNRADFDNLILPLTARLEGRSEPVRVASPRTDPATTGVGRN